MNFKKYNIIFVFMLVLVIAIPVVSLSAGKSESSSSDVVVDDLPSIEVGPSDQTSSSSKPTSYSFNDQWSAYNHLLTNSLSKSYFADTKQTLKATAKVGISMSFDQNVTCKTYVTSEGKILEETYSGGTKKFFNTTFYDGTNVYTKTVDGEFEVGNQPSVSPEVYGVDEYLSENGVLPAFLMKLNKKCFPSSKPIKLDGGYYCVKATVTDSSIWKDYLKKVQVMSGSEIFPTMNSCSIQFVYSPKTGKIVRIIMDENYSIKYMGLNVTCESRTTKNFSMIGENVQLPSMSYMGL